MPVGGSDLDRQRNAGGLSEHAALDAAFAAIVRVGACFFPPRGAFVIAPSSASQLQSMPWNSLYPSDPMRQKVANTPASIHSRNRRYADEHEQMPVPSSAFHCMPVRNTTLTRWRPWPPDWTRTAGGIPVDAVLALATAVRSAPRAYRLTDSRRLAYLVSWLHRSIEVIRLSTS